MILQAIAVPHMWRLNSAIWGFVCFFAFFFHASFKVSNCTLTKIIPIIRHHKETDHASVWHIEDGFFSWHQVIHKPAVFIFRNPRCRAARSRDTTTAPLPVNALLEQLIFHRPALAGSAPHMRREIYFWDDFKMAFPLSSTFIFASVHCNGTANCFTVKTCHRKSHFS